MATRGMGPERMELSFAAVAIRGRIFDQNDTLKPTLMPPREPSRQHAPVAPRGISFATGTYAVPETFTFEHHSTLQTKAILWNILACYVRELAYSRPLGHLYISSAPTKDSLGRPSFVVIDLGLECRLSKTVTMSGAPKIRSNAL